MHVSNDGNVRVLETKFINFGSIVIPTLLSSRAKKERKKD